MERQSELSDRAEFLMQILDDKLDRFARRSTRIPVGLAPSKDDYFASLLVQIAIFGGIYLVGRLAQWAVPLVWQSAVTGPPLQIPDALLGLVATCLVATAVFVIGMVLTAMIAGVLITASRLILRVMQIAPARDRFGAGMGASAAMAASFLPMRGVDATNYDLIGFWAEAPFLAGHAIAATSLGVLGGLVASARGVRRRRRGHIKNRNERITLWAIMIFMVPLSAGLAVLKALELLSLRQAIYLSAFAVSAAAVYPIIHWQVNRCALRHIHRRRTKRLAARST